MNNEAGACSRAWQQQDVLPCYWSWGRAGRAEPAAGSGGEAQPLLCPWFGSCGQWEPPGCSQHHLQPPAHSPVLQSWAVRQPSEGSTKMLPVPQILGVVSWAVSEAVVAHTLP